MLKRHFLILYDDDDDDGFDDDDDEGEQTMKRRPSLPLSSSVGHREIRHRRRTFVTWAIDYHPCPTCHSRPGRT